MNRYIHCTQYEAIVLIVNTEKLVFFFFSARLEILLEHTPENN